jgi:hypothetical protein
VPLPLVVDFLIRIARKRHLPCDPLERLINAANRTTAQAVRVLFESLAALATPGSRFCFDWLRLSVMSGRAFNPGFETMAVRRLLGKRPSDPRRGRQFVGSRFGDICCPGLIKAPRGQMGRPLPPVTATRWPQPRNRLRACAAGMHSLASLPSARQLAPSCTALRQRSLTRATAKTLQSLTPLCWSPGFARGLAPTAAAVTFPQI